MKEIKDVKILGVEMEFYCIIPHGSTNLGLVWLQCEGRSFVMDTVASRWYEEDNHTRIEIDLEVEDWVMENCKSKFDLTADDLMNPNLIATIWHEEAIEVSEGTYVEPSYQTLYVQFIKEDGEPGMTQAIELETE